MFGGLFRASGPPPKPKPIEGKKKFNRGDAKAEAGKRRLRDEDEPQSKSKRYKLRKKQRAEEAKRAKEEEAKRKAAEEPKLSKAARRKRNLYRRLAEQAATPGHAAESGEGGKAERRKEKKTPREASPAAEAPGRPMEKLSQGQRRKERKRQAALSEAPAEEARGSTSERKAEKRRRLSEAVDAAPTATGAGMETCPSGHGLKAFRTPEPGYTCDQCGASQKQGTDMRRCQKCNYDVCPRCRGQRVAKEKGTPGKKGDGMLPGSALPSRAEKAMSASDKAAERLSGSRFRWLNEQLYTSTGAEAKKLYDDDPSLAVAYHKGMRAQQAKWPRNPLDDIIAWCQTFPVDAVIGDFGCGEARLAATLSDRTVHSFDLLPVNERVTPCNLAAVPLKDGTIDIAVFCLALMGTDWLDFVREAWRCLVPDGLLHIAEVESRFEDVHAMIRSIESVGFRKVLLKPSDFFVDIRFVRLKSGKGAKLPQGAPGTGAKLGACTYKRR